MNVFMEMPSNETIKQAVMADMGISFLSTRTLRHELASGHIVIMDVADTPVQGQWQVIHLKNKKLSPTLKAFKSFLMDQGESLINTWA